MPGGLEVRSRVRPEMPGRARILSASSFRRAGGRLAAVAVMARSEWIGLTMQSSWPALLIFIGTNAVGHCQMSSYRP